MLSTKTFQFSQRCDAWKTLWKFISFPFLFISYLLWLIDSISNWKQLNQTYFQEVLQNSPISHTWIWANQDKLRIKISSVVYQGKIVNQYESLLMLLVRHSQVEVNKLSCITGIDPSHGFMHVPSCDGLLIVTSFHLYVINKTNRCSYRLD